MKKALLIVLALVLMMVFCSGGIASPPRDDWPEGPAAQSIPVYMGGTIQKVTEKPNSDFILIGDVSKDEAKAYWEEAQKAGFTNIVSKSGDTIWYSGFTYVAHNGQGTTLSVTWSPGRQGVMTLLAVLY